MLNLRSLVFRWLCTLLVVVLASGPASPLLPQSADGQHAAAARTTKAAVPEVSTDAADDPNRPTMYNRTHPYGNLPSLRDLYTQLPDPMTARLQRFGMNIFRQGTGNAEELPMDLPAGPDYVLGPGDGLAVNLTGSTSQRLTLAVDREGRVLLPESGAVVVAGQTLAQAQQLIERALNTEFQKVKADVSLTRLRTVRVYVVGDVQRPGAYDISSLSTPLNALYAAGGPTARGSLRKVRHYRGRQLVREVDLYDLLLRGVRDDLERLRAGDTVLVPPVGPQVSVAGMVHRPAIYELNKEEEIAEVLELAGGVLVTATLRQISVERIEAHQQRVMLSLHLPESGDKDAMAQALGSFRVQDGDRVMISAILPYSEKTVYLEGHVFRPGKYPYRDGLTVNDLLRSYEDLLPEPAEHAEIVRLQAPDFRPLTIEFKLGEVLGGDDPIKLQPFDTIRIFGRYDFDPPEVSIYGEVLRPGKYPLGQAMTAADLVRMSGGFKRSALVDGAELVSYTVQNGRSIASQRQMVEIEKAMAGDGSADVRLKPNDVLTVRQLSGWNDIGASVTINGEVQHPGIYGIADGEKLSAIVLRAGGFRASAYPAGTVLERVQVRELAEKSRQELIRRLESGADLRIAAGTAADDRMALLQAAKLQEQQVLAELKGHPPSGRLVVRIRPDVRQWQNTPNDIEVRAGDVITIPKRPNFVLVNGQVYSPSAITYAPGRNGTWYLRQAGGATELGNRKAIFVIRADGSVIGNSAGAWWKGNVLGTVLQPGDTVVVPERILTGGGTWKELLAAAQVMSSLAIAARVATSF